MRRQELDCSGPFISMQGMQGHKCNEDIRQFVNNADKENETIFTKPLSG